MKSVQQRPADAFRAVDAAARTAAVRMHVAVQQRKQPFARHRGRVVLVLANHRDDLAAARFNLGIRKRRLHDDVGER